LSEKPLGMSGICGVPGGSGVASWSTISTADGALGVMAGPCAIGAGGGASGTALIWTLLLTCLNQSFLGVGFSEAEFFGRLCFDLKDEPD